MKLSAIAIGLVLVLAGVSVHRLPMRFGRTK